MASASVLEGRRTIEMDEIAREAVALARMEGLDGQYLQFDEYVVIRVERIKKPVIVEE